MHPRYYGKTEDGVLVQRPDYDLLQQALIPLESRDECNEKKSYNGTVPQRAVCGGFKDGRVDACQRDSGGPLACEHGKAGTSLIGLHELVTAVPV
ncbi:unnamed protein product [Porites evermanni]|uniref:Peptidase S1 domain-containing protein n=1 Tax=Porites evermanni TaxID=104178 RepID=A0ABN8LHC5_9CNID|nr:unnamed protein product [Porites evermanni]